MECNLKRDLEYERNNIGYDCQYTEENGGGIKCKNYIICESILPDWWFEWKQSYLCSNCNTLFGTWSNKLLNINKTGKGVLKIFDNLECPVCLEVTKCISQPNCDHYACIECFKKCYYGESEYPLIEICNEQYVRCCSICLK